MACNEDIQHATYNLLLIAMMMSWCWNEMMTVYNDEKIETDIDRYWKRMKKEHEWINNAYR